MKDTNAVVFVIDDDSSVREAIKNLIMLVGHWDVTVASDEDDRKFDAMRGQFALQIESARSWQLHIEHHACGQVRSFTLQEFLRGSEGLDAQAVRAMKAGALDFLTKPWRDQDLLDAAKAGPTRSSFGFADDLASASASVRAIPRIHSSAAITLRTVLPPGRLAQTS